MTDRAEPLRILHVSVHDAAGGAGRACFNLHTGLRRLGQRSTIVASHVSSNDPDVVHHSPPRLRRARWARQQRRLERPEGLIGYGFTEDQSPSGREAARRLPPADVVNLHVFGGMLDFAGLFAAIPPRAPVVWSLHDMNGFTGGCHFDAGCSRFLHRCGACPQLASTTDDDLSRRVWERKHAALVRVPRDRLHLVTPSRFFAGEARRSSLLGRFETTTIRYAVDVDVFRPRDRARARAALGIPPQADVVGFVADSLLTRRKGFRFVEEAMVHLAAVRRPLPLLLTVGANDPGIATGVPRVHVDLVEDDDRLAEIYSAMDLLLMPSLQESMGFTALEALACERPVVAFDAGPLPEMVRPAETGALVAYGDARALADAAAILLDDESTLRRLGGAGRRLVQEECSFERQAGRYLDVYRTLRAGRAA